MAEQNGFRALHITSVATTAMCRNVTHSANLHTYKPLPFLRNDL